MARTQTFLVVAIDQDPVPGWGYHGEGHQHHVQRLLEQTIPHYNPVVIIAPEPNTAKSWLPTPPPEFPFRSSHPMASGLCVLMAGLLDTIELIHKEWMSLPDYKNRKPLHQFIDMWMDTCKGSDDMMGFLHPERHTYESDRVGIFGNKWTI